MYIENLDDRRLLSVSGADAEHFLENLITCDVAKLQINEIRFGALLSPQGKILFDFFLFKDEATYTFDVSARLIEDFMKRLIFYRLRAKVDIQMVDAKTVSAIWGVSNYSSALSFPDSRNHAMGFRCYDEEPDGFQKGDYRAKRIEVGIPEGHFDFEYGDAYPHETLMDQFGGVDFKKGCYVGQEVVSRMQHRGSAKKRVIQVSSEYALPETGTAILADGKPAGILGSVNGNNGLALLRLDRVHKAEVIKAEETKITATIPDWVSFEWPEKA